jgi:hypothetical protein
LQVFRQTARHAARALTLLLALVAAPSWCGAREYLQVFVTAPYLELHTGPGRGFPVTQVVARDEGLDVLKRRTDWFKVRTARGIEGWASYKDMLSVVLADGSLFTFPMGDRTGFPRTRASSASSRGLQRRYAHLRLWLTLFQLTARRRAVRGPVPGNASNGTTVDLGLTHVFVPEWRLSPFVMLGTGIVRIEPKATLVAPLDRTDQTAYVGGGLRFYLTRRFFARAEYKSHIVFTSRNDNEEVDEWKLVFAFFF